MSFSENDPLFKKLLQHKQQVMRLPKGSETYQQALIVYNDLLEDLMLLIDEPLPPEYEINEHEMSKFYVNYKRSYAEKGHPHFSTFIKKTEIIALVTILSVPLLGELRMRVRPNEVLKGQLERSFLGKTIYIIPPRFGIERDKWLRKGRRELIFANGPPSRPYFITTGTLGRMPLVEKQRMMYVYSFCMDQKFFEGLHLVEEADMLRLEWKEVREYIISLTT